MNDDEKITPLDFAEETAKELGHYEPEFLSQIVNAILLTAIRHNRILWRVAVSEYGAQIVWETFTRGLLHEMFVLGVKQAKVLRMIFQAQGIE